MFCILQSFPIGMLRKRTSAVADMESGAFPIRKSAAPLFCILQSSANAPRHVSAVADMNAEHSLYEKARGTIAGGKRLTNS
ncbi:hypothetical protein AFK68_01575 [Hydrocoleum sp. CS-953]|nr:hypothetical protein AFK68_01575 [Hydrocoleum sp. CS-953]